MISGLTESPKSEEINLNYKRLISYLIEGYIVGAELQTAKIMLSVCGKLDCPQDRWYLEEKDFLGFPLQHIYILNFIWCKYIGYSGFDRQYLIWRETGDDSLNAGLEFGWINVKKRSSSDDFKYYSTVNYESKGIFSRKLCLPRAWLILCNKRHVEYFATQNRLNDLWRVYNSFKRIAGIFEELMKYDIDNSDQDKEDGYCWNYQWSIFSALMKRMELYKSNTNALMFLRKENFDYAKGLIKDVETLDKKSRLKLQEPFLL